MVKMSGKEYKDFMSDEKFWEGLLLDNDIVEVNGIQMSDSCDTTEIKDVDFVKIVDGNVYDPESDLKDARFETFFKRWRRSRDNIFVVVECKRDELAKLSKIIKEAGYKLISD